MDILNEPKKIIIQIKDGQSVTLRQNSQTLNLVLYADKEHFGVVVTSDQARQIAAALNEYATELDGGAFKK